VTFRGTFREKAWQRVQAQAITDGIRYEPWSGEEFPTWSLPALEAAKCAALQGDDLFERLHLSLYEAFFTRGINIERPEELVTIAEHAGCDMTRYQADLTSGHARALVLSDYESARAQHAVRAIPTVVINGAQPLVGLHPLKAYRSALLNLS